MWARVCVLVTVVACYSPRVVPGAPCTPGPQACPRGLACELVDGDFACVEPGGGNGMPDAPQVDPDGDVADAPDASVAIDGMQGAWTLVRSAGSMGDSTTIGASGEGNLIVVGIETDDAGAVTMVTDNAGNTYLPVQGSRAENNTEDLGVEIWYAKGSKAGATVVTADANIVHAVVIWEVAGIDTVNPLVTSTHVDDQASSTSPRGAAITTTGPGQFVVSIAIVANVVTGLSNTSAFTNDHFTFGNGWAHLTDPMAAAGTYQAQWNQPSSGRSCASSAAFRVGM